MSPTNFGETYRTESAPARDGQTGLRKDIETYIKYTLGKPVDRATPRDVLSALSIALRPRIVNAIHRTNAGIRSSRAKTVAYLSMEFLMGRSLENNLISFGLYQAADDALRDFGIGLSDVLALEDDAALGNGGLGRLAACFLDSMATLDIPATGYGLLYEYGLFRQEFARGEQRECADRWAAQDSPWLIKREDQACIVPVYGRVIEDVDSEGNYNPMWMDWRGLIGIPYDFPVVGFGGKTVNALRLYSARASEDFHMKVFNRGDYVRAIEEKISSETISKVLYPADDFAAGQELRLLQEYFLVACAIRDIVRRHTEVHSDFESLPETFAIQLNDTHPALAVAELMRLLVDEESLEWEVAWRITTKTLAYTNHTLLPEALETWPVPLVEKVLPRHLQLIYEINRRFLDQVAEKWPGDTGRLRRMSIIEEGGSKHVRMAHLAIVGAHSVNGVAAMHSELVKNELVPEFHALWPEKFNNKTNGITQRRWLLQSNPMLSKLITDTIGVDWITNLSALRGLEPMAEDPSFQERFRAVKELNKKKLQQVIGEVAGVSVDPKSLFDIQIKRIHEYKRQLLNILHVVHLYQRIVEDGFELAQPQAFIFAGKAAPGYYLAKKIIHFINAVGAVVNRDPRVNDQIKVAFLPNYRVSLAEVMIPAADVSEQISTAGKEASGTGNMKLALNGALTLGTLDGANVEIREEVGEDNIFIFGLTVEEIARRRREGYNPRALEENDPVIQRVLATLTDGTFCPGAPGTFRPLYDRLIHQGDEYFVLADFHAYVEAQARVRAVYQDRQDWTRRAILNVARMGKFSSDRTISEYARDIWHVDWV